ncbi:MAG: hypothetical protein ABW321_19370 [Polyangiales bacterium]
MARPTCAAVYGLALALAGACGESDDGGAAVDPPAPVEVDAGPPQPESCTGNVEVAGREFVRVESEACYVTRAKPGEPECAPLSDPSLRDRLQDQVNACDAWVDFVMDSAPARAVPASCDALLYCCQSREQLARRQPCEDVVDNLSPELDEESAGALCDDALAPRCGDGSDLPPKTPTATSGESTQFALCCYKTCGHDFCH